MDREALGGDWEGLGWDWEGIGGIGMDWEALGWTGRHWDGMGEGIFRERDEFVVRVDDIPALKVGGPGGG